MTGTTEIALLIRFGADKYVCGCTSVAVAVDTAGTLGGKRVFVVGGVHVALIAAGDRANGEGGSGDDLLGDLRPSPAQHKAAGAVAVEELDTNGVRAFAKVNRIRFLCHGVAAVVVDNEDVVQVHLGSIIALGEQSPLAR